MKITSELLKERQLWSLERKIEESWHRIEQWYNYWRMENRGVYISFSGGKDSTVLLDLVRSNPFLKNSNIPAVFVDTGLEYPEIRDFVKAIDNVVWLKPKMNFIEVIEKYGYPVVSKEISMGVNRYRNTKSDIQKQLRMHGGFNPSSGKKQARSISKKWHHLIDAPFLISEKCCDVMKKQPFKRYEKESKRKAFVGTMASDSSLRKKNYLKNGCSVFSESGRSAPMMFWLEKDIWEYINKKNLPYSKIYDMGESRTGCMFCAFGCNIKAGENRFQRMKKNHPSQWDFCMNRLGMKEVLEYLKVDCE